ncbi:hypothetical protein CVT24_003653 [Panaeolus cyanescens]|uniref:Uncharacterized protein n=1 Tax=Panaeolus cyanescens TaxID=181874 RepID=A0A409WC69_9AGAR|nr:hypothetical protein CVT24_003653 [Panaeolus cyanescens]
MQTIILLDVEKAFDDPAWTKRVCDHFVIFEGASTTVLIAVCELIMILRVYALYERSALLLSVLLIIWATQIAVSAVGIHTGQAVPLPSFLTGCILSGRSPQFSAQWVAPLITDSVIFGLTLWRTRQYIRSSNKKNIMIPTIQILLRDGIMYFFIIFSANLMNTLIYFTCTEDLKAVGATFSELITSVMISRLVLNLRATASLPPNSSSTGTRRHGTIELDTFIARTIGNLGEDFIMEEDREAEVVQANDWRETLREGKGIPLPSVPETELCGPVPNDGRTFV